MKTKQKYNRLKKVLKNLSGNLEENTVINRFLEDKLGKINETSPQLYFTVNAIKMINDIESKTNRVV